MTTTTQIPAEIPEGLAMPALAAAARVREVLAACEPAIDELQEAVSAIEVYVHDNDHVGDDVLGWICDELLDPVSSFRDGELIRDGWWVDDAQRTARDRYFARHPL